ncbi:MAG TPA: NAD(+)/NADH kinase [Ilumatobacter sp.]|nr:NAD(+)/NADH kinase [Ilumatobacter sp.]
MSTVVVIAHHQRDDARILADDLARWLAANGHAVVLPDEGDRIVPDADLALVLGGDGTMLHAVHLLDGAPVPLLGVNMGHLGYLTEVEPGDVHDALQRWEQGAEGGRWHLDERMMLDVTATSAAGTELGTWRALNEAVVDKQQSGTVHLLVRIDGEPFTSYAADGLIVATPTGSTAYSLSARGPIVSPKHRALLVTPVAPHMLFDRTLVLDPSEEVVIEVIGAHDVTIAVDGRATCDLTTGAVVRCAPSAATASFVRFGERPYHQVLKAKFGLTDR